DAKSFPRTIGRHDFTLGGIKGNRAVLPYQQWMFQRPLRFYQSLSEANKGLIDPLLEKLGGLSGLQSDIPLPLDYTGHKLVVAPS
ncbi:MAG: hypothetical protein COB49_12530, partial [Alphaproteobacteria bacterium]